jgi:hypothetical protein
MSVLEAHVFPEIEQNMAAEVMALRAKGNSQIKTPKVILWLTVSITEIT